MNSTLDVSYAGLVVKDKKQPIETQQLLIKMTALLNGRLNCRGQFTLTPNATQTIVEDAICTTVSVIPFMPVSASAAAAIPTTWISSTTNGSFVVEHASSAATDREFRYAVIG
jgi:hypothetical protein